MEKFSEEASNEFRDELHTIQCQCSYGYHRTEVKDVRNAVGQDRRWKLGIFCFVRLRAEAPINVSLCVHVYNRLVGGTVHI
jgi:hypothetical protein